jgi:O-Antigen ligase
MSTTLSRASGRPGRARAFLAVNPTAPFTVAALVVFLALGASEAGFYAVGQPGLGWYPATLMVLALLVTAAFAAGAPRSVPRPLAAALVLLSAFTLWSYLSITWADQQAVAWDGANRSAAYVLVLALFSLWPLSSGHARLLIAVLGLEIVGLGVVELLRVNAAADPLTFFVDARLAEPAGYINANVALWTLGLWPCLYLASAREVHPLVRGPALGGAAVLACLGLMGQSRGWVLVVPLAALAFVIVMPARARALAALAAVAIGTLLVSGATVAVHDDFTPGRFDSLLADATGQILSMAAVLAAVGLVAGLVDRRVTVSPRTGTIMNRGAVAALVIALVVGAGAALTTTEDPVGGLSDTWQDFKDGGEGGDASEGSRLSSVGTNRYDFWKVAWERFGDHPVRGIGSANFQQDYLERGESAEQPRYPHSLVLGVLSQTGLVGFLLLGLALLAAFAAGVSARRGARAEHAALVGVALVVFLYWLLHASVDWFWEFAGVTAPAFAMLGVAAATGLERPLARRERSRVGGGRRGRAAAGTAVALAGVVLAVSLALPWLSERETRRAIADWTGSSITPFDRLERASSLNPLSPRPHLVAGTIALQVGDRTRARSEFEEVLELERRTPFALAELAAMESERGRRRAAQDLLRRANRLAPRDPVISAALKRVLSGRRINVRDLNSSFRRAARSVTGRD